MRTFVLGVVASALVAACSDEVVIGSHPPASGGGGSGAVGGAGPGPGGGGGVSSDACGPTQPCVDEGLLPAVCVHDAGCDSAGTCAPVDDEAYGCPGACTCDGVFVCTDVEANLLGVDLTADPACLACGGALAELKRAITSSVGFCTAVARFRHTDLEPLGVAIVCDRGRMPAIDLETAETIAEAALGPTDDPLVHLGGAEAWIHVFWAPASDAGGVGVVSHYGVVPFAATSSAMGSGTILEPETWLSAELLDVPCGLQPFPMPGSVGFDLRDGSALTSAQVAPVVDRLWRTPVPRLANEEPGMSFASAVGVVLYAPSIDPDAMEWVTFLSWPGNVVFE
jgi:hypothetical protein